MPSSTERRTEISPALPAGLRLRMQPDRSGRGLFDGGWWPRTTDPAAELPGLVHALDQRHGRITRVLLGTADWDGSKPRRMAIGSRPGSRVVKIGWFDSMPVGLLTAISVSGERTDLLTIPPRASEEAASSAMGQAAKAGNREHSPAILARIAAAAGGAAC